MGEKIIKTRLMGYWGSADKKPRYREQSVEDFIQSTACGNEGIESTLTATKELIARFVAILHLKGVLSDEDIFTIADIPDHLQNSDEGSRFVEAKD